MGCVLPVMIDEYDENDPFPSQRMLCTPPDSEQYLADLLQFELDRDKPDWFSYLKCLEPTDCKAFQAELVQTAKYYFKDRETQEDYIIQGAIDMRTWRNIMQQIPLSVTYRVWRHAYWGEHVGKKVDDPANISMFAHRHVLVQEFPSYHCSTDDTPSHTSPTSMPSMPSIPTPVVVNLLYNSNQSFERISEFAISPSGWSDTDASEAIWIGDNKHMVY